MNMPQNSLYLSLCCSFLLMLNTCLAAAGNETDRIALFALKHEISVDPFQVLTSWNDSIDHCSWQGVTCSSGRVTSLDLEGQNLQGALSPYIGNITFLGVVNLSMNNFHGRIPQEISHLVRLQYLLLSNNTFSGDIPSSLVNCSELITINLIDNNLNGKIFPEISSLSKLRALGLAGNQFTGNIPASYGNLSSLTTLSLMENRLNGNIPHELCSIPRLWFFQVSFNNLTGIIPPCLYNHSYIEMFSVVGNQLEGSLPSNIGFTFRNIRRFYLGSNNFSGLVPVSLTNASRLEVIDFHGNYFTGSLPMEFGNLQNLTNLNFNRNRLGTTTSVDDLQFITSLTNCRNLEMIEFHENFLRGPLPDSISNLSTTLINLDAGDNKIYGSIPEGIQNLINLESIFLQGNSLTGNIPVTIGNFKNLTRLNLQGNLLSGEIPPSLGNLIKLSDLNLGGNKLNGTIPRALENCRNLLNLNLSHNYLSGTIPTQVIGTSSLIASLYLQDNSLNGTLPLQLGGLPNVVTLALSNNNFSGQIPQPLGYCLNLVNLFLDGNFFHGEIPQSMSGLRGLENLDLSRNQLSGEIPEFLESFPLSNLNLSFNQLEGQVPNEGVFKNVSGVSFAGNKKLCGGSAEFQLPPCDKRTKKSGLSIVVIISLVVGILFVIVLVCFVLMCYRKTLLRRSTPANRSSNQANQVSYGELLKATNEFSADNLIGSGSYGSVYKGHLHEFDKIVAVKVLHVNREGAFKSFLNECNALRNIRHRNLTKLITTCSSVDFQGNEFQALVFYFMPNGSLEEWLHPRIDEKSLVPKSLNFVKRLSIAIDVASALEYLHHHFQTPVVHCDLKPSNVLLDDDMVAHVSDFGLSKMFCLDSSSGTSESEVSSIVIKGSIGYVAPEYIMADRVSTQGDVYSYGILLLEMFTKRKPTDDIFVDGLSIHNYAEMALHNSVNDIIDPMVLSEKNVDLLDNASEFNAKERLHECLVWVIRLGVLCSSESARDRVSMKEVVHELHRIRDYHQCKEVLTDKLDLSILIDT
ncbi:non-specific serine/threonine protein kinase [Ranunculus cassubicifolius]